MAKNIKTSRLCIKIIRDLVAVFMHFISRDVSITEQLRRNCSLTI